MQTFATSVRLLERARENEEDAWESIVRIYRPFIGRILTLSGMREPDREDLLQEVMTTLVREVPNFRHSGRPGAFRCWLRSVVRNRILGYQRYHAVRSHLPLDSEVFHVSATNELWEHFDRQHDLHVMHELLQLIQSEFTNSTWTAFQMQMLEGCRASDVATALGMSTSAVLSAKSRVLRRLRCEATGLIE